MTLISRYKNGNKELRIYQDENPESPREWDNLGTMLCFHSRYDLGDEPKDETAEQFKGWSEIEEYLIKNKKAVVILPLYLYDHSGLSIKVGSFQGLLPQGHAEFDSGQVGFIYATAEDIKENFKIKRITAKTRDRASDILRAEVESYDQFLRGDVYGFELVTIEKCKTCGCSSEKSLDSCWGFCGYDFKENGLFETAKIKDIDKWEEVAL